MLASLKIENVAVIEKAEVNFTPGFNVLTGETGAGKSILIDSINAILGNRTSRELVRSGAQKACIWATFESIPTSVKKQLEKCGYEVTDESDDGAKERKSEAEVRLEELQTLYDRRLITEEEYQEKRRDILDRL